MNSDHELEAALRRYRPAGPGPGLRARVLNPSPRVPRTWPWAVAAAALLTMALSASSAAARVRGAERYTAQVTDAPWIDAETMAELRQAYGDRLSALLTSAAVAAETNRPEPEPTEVDPWR